MKFLLLIFIKFLVLVSSTKKNLKKDRLGYYNHYYYDSSSSSSSSSYDDFENSHRCVTLECRQENLDTSQNVKFFNSDDPGPKLEACKIKYWFSVGAGYTLPTTTKTFSSESQPTSEQYNNVNIEVGINSGVMRSIQYNHVCTSDNPCYLYSRDHTEPWSSCDSDADMITNNVILKKASNTDNAFWGDANDNFPIFFNIEYNNAIYNLGTFHHPACSGCNSKNVELSLILNTTSPTPTCTSNYCNGHGTCTVLNNILSCNCVNGYEGTTCDEEVCSLNIHSSSKFYTPPVNVVTYSTKPDASDGWEKLCVETNTDENLEFLPLMLVENRLDVSTLTQDYSEVQDYSTKFISTTSANGDYAGYDIIFYNVKRSSSSYELNYLLKTSKNVVTTHETIMNIASSYNVVLDIASTGELLHSKGDTYYVTTFKSFKDVVLTTQEIGSSKYMTFIPLQTKIVSSHEKVVYFDYDSRNNINHWSYSYYFDGNGIKGFNSYAHGLSDGITPKVHLENNCINLDGNCDVIAYCHTYSYLYFTTSTCSYINSRIQNFINVNICTDDRLLTLTEETEDTTYQSGYVDRIYGKRIASKTECVYAIKQKYHQQDNIEISNSDLPYGCIKKTENSIVTYHYNNNAASDLSCLKSIGGATYQCVSLGDTIRKSDSGGEDATNDVINGKKRYVGSLCELFVFTTSGLEILEIKNDNKLKLNVYAQELPTIETSKRSKTTNGYYTEFCIDKQSGKECSTDVNYKGQVALKSEISSIDLSQTMNKITFVTGNEFVLENDAKNYIRGSINDDTLNIGSMVSTSDVTHITFTKNNVLIAKSTGLYLNENKIDDISISSNDGMQIKMVESPTLIIYKTSYTLNNGRKENYVTKIILENGNVIKSINGDIRLYRDNTMLVKALNKQFHTIDLVELGHPFPIFNMSDTNEFLNSHHFVSSSTECQNIATLFNLPFVRSSSHNFRQLINTNKGCYRLFDSHGLSKVIWMEETADNSEVDYYKDDPRAIVSSYQLGGIEEEMYMIVYAFPFISSNDPTKNCVNGVVKGRGSCSCKCDKGYGLHDCSFLLYSHVAGSCKNRDLDNFFHTSRSRNKAKAYCSTQGVLGLNTDMKDIKAIQDDHMTINSQYDLNQIYFLGENYNYEDEDSKNLYFDDTFTVKDLYSQDNSAVNLNANYYTANQCYDIFKDDCADPLDCTGNGCQWDCSKLSPSNGCNAHMLFEPTSIDEYNTQNSVYSTITGVNKFITRKSITHEIIQFGNLNEENKPYFTNAYNYVDLCCDMPVTCDYYNCEANGLVHKHYANLIQGCSESTCCIERSPCDVGYYYDDVLKDCITCPYGTYQPNANVYVTSCTAKTNLECNSENPSITVTLSAPLNDATQDSTCKSLEGSLCHSDLKCLDNLVCALLFPNQSLLNGVQTGVCKKHCEDICSGLSTCEEILNFDGQNEKVCVEKLNAVNDTCFDPSFGINPKICGTYNTKNLVCVRSDGASSKGYCVEENDIVESCDKGTFLNSLPGQSYLEKTKCLECPANTYQPDDNTDVSSCIVKTPIESCATGTEYINGGKIADNECKPCDPGNWNSQENAEQLNSCHPKSVQSCSTVTVDGTEYAQGLNVALTDSTADSTSCVQCGQNQFADFSGTGQCTDKTDSVCGNGHVLSTLYSDLTKDSVCTPCERNFYKVVEQGPWWKPADQCTSGVQNDLCVDVTKENAADLSSVCSSTDNGKCIINMQGGVTNLNLDQRILLFKAIDQMYDKTDGSIPYVNENTYGWGVSENTPNDGNLYKDHKESQYNEYVWKRNHDLQNEKQANCILKNLELQQNRFTYVSSNSNCDTAAGDPSTDACFDEFSRHDITPDKWRCYSVSDLVSDTGLQIPDYTAKDQKNGDVTIPFRLGEFGDESIHVPEYTLLTMCPDLNPGHVFGNYCKLPAIVTNDETTCTPKTDSDCGLGKETTHGLLVSLTDPTADSRKEDCVECLKWQQVGPLDYDNTGTCVGKPCPVGQGIHKEDGTCKPCTGEFFSDHDGHGECQAKRTSCGKGKYFSATSTVDQDHKCLDCSGNTYQDQDVYSETQCTKTKTDLTCSLGNGLSVPLSNKKEDSLCRPCSVGYYQNQNNGGVCLRKTDLSCNQGYVLDNSLTSRYIDSVCKLCPSDLAQGEDGFTGTTCSPKVSGCRDENAFNYNPEANVDSPCIAKVFGCLDIEALNYNSTANTDDGKCIAKVFGCTNANAFNYNSYANTDDNTCVVKVEGCTYENALNYNSDANVDDGSCTVKYPGCNSASNGAADNLNYNPTANVDDGSCIQTIYGCMDDEANNFYPYATVQPDEVCTYNTFGCTDANAANYDQSAQSDDGSCVKCNADSLGEAGCLETGHSCTYQSNTFTFTHPDPGNTETSTVECAGVAYTYYNKYDESTDTDTYPVLMPGYQTLDMNQEYEARCSTLNDNVYIALKGYPSGKPSGVFQFQFAESILSANTWTIRGIDSGTNPPKDLGYRASKHIEYYQTDGTWKTEEDIYGTQTFYYEVLKDTFCQGGTCSMTIRIKETANTNGYGMGDTVSDYGSVNFRIFEIINEIEPYACLKEGCTVCETCEKGQKKTGSSCESCPSGKYIDQESHTLSSCMEKPVEVCNPGQQFNAPYSDRTANSACEDCPTGTYSFRTDGAACKPKTNTTCPEGSGLDIPLTNLKEDSKCVQCDPATHYSDVEDGSACKAKTNVRCPAGQGLQHPSQNLVDSTCVACDGDSFSDINDGSGCQPKTNIACPKGSGLTYNVSDKTHDSKCVSCRPLTHYSDVEDNSACKLKTHFGCPAGLALSYPLTDTHHDSECITIVIKGCTDDRYTEYDASATQDDGSCSTPIACTSTDCNGQSASGNKVDGCTCNCDTGYSGDHCETASYVCAHGTAAAGTSSTQTTKCTSCSTGYYLDGEECKEHTKCGVGFGTVNYDSDSDFDTVCQQCTPAPSFNDQTDYSPCGEHTGCESTHYYTYKQDSDACTPCADGKITLDAFATACVVKVEGCTDDRYTEFIPNANVNVGCNTPAPCTQADCNEATGNKVDGCKCEAPIHYDDKIYNVCEGDNVEVVFGGNHNIYEVESTLYANYDNSFDESKQLIGFDPLRSSLIVSGLGAQPNTIRFFICTTHPLKKFKTYCAAVSGCTDNRYTEYNANANVDDGSCKTLRIDCVGDWIDVCTIDMYIQEFKVTIDAANGGNECTNTHGATRTTTIPCYLGLNNSEAQLKLHLTEYNAEIVFTNLENSELTENVLKLFFNVKLDALEKLKIRLESASEEDKEKIIKGIQIFSPYKVVLKSSKCNENNLLCKESINDLQLAGETYISN